LWYLICDSGTVGGAGITSDRRLKTDIVDLNSKYGLDFGLIADDLWLWSKLKDEEGTQTIQTQEFIGVFIKAIQELYKLFVNGTPPERQQAIDIQEHKCAGVYNLENDIDELVKDKEQLTIDLFALKTQNQI
jgi:hypothetical protein